ncbi:MAG: LegC family aminotransferase [Deferribacterales bacterium]
MFEKTIAFIKKLYPYKDFIALHEPVLGEEEKKYLCECVDSGFVSSVGSFVNLFERRVAEFCGASFAVATVNGTSALHCALKLCGVGQGDEVITQALTFVATANAISYCGARPVFVDINKDNMGLSAESLEEFLSINAVKNNDGSCVNKLTGRRISACLPMHTFGLPADMEQIVNICDKYNIPVVEDSAESMGSFIGKKHTGLFGKVGILSFNGNKIITTGGGGMIITNDEKLAAEAKHITTTAKKPHKWEFFHDMTGFNYRMPNVNAALGCAQLDKLSSFLENKRETAMFYKDFFKSEGISFVSEPENCTSNYWLNAVIMSDKTERDAFLEETNSAGVMTRPLWEPMNRLPMYADCVSGNLENTEWLSDRVVNIPSGVRG